MTIASRRDPLLGYHTTHVFLEDDGAIGLGIFRRQDPGVHGEPGQSVVEHITGHAVILGIRPHSQ